MILALSVLPFVLIVVDVKHHFDFRAITHLCPDGNKVQRRKTAAYSLMYSTVFIEWSYEGLGRYFAYIRYHGE